MGAAQNIHPSQDLLDMCNVVFLVWLEGLLYLHPKCFSTLNDHARKRHPWRPAVSVVHFQVRIFPNDDTSYFLVAYIRRCSEDPGQGKNDLFGRLTSSLQNHLHRRVKGIGHVQPILVMLRASRWGPAGLQEECHFHGPGSKVGATDAAFRRHQIARVDYSFGCKCFQRSILNRRRHSYTCIVRSGTPSLLDIEMKEKVWK
ncbi:hypothetical protein P154DRAFT_536676 [Amniculicola lignicola CBS 123094]|uniref:Uncharacterized protein n=1 Tax=Amniculicola lignicola CBS 123094 TaxID=1392246 RepID=A0A6A5WFT3_9PLEO|nr:hypothetical protein P154DRAFT_536676 [Amniculicola lignicola CBS 123094]